MRNDALAGTDLVVSAGQVFCAETGLDAEGAVATRGGRILAAGPDVCETTEARCQLEFPEGVLLPGLVDLHAHPARGGSKYGVDPDEHFLPRGVTTVMSQGDAGALNWEYYRRNVIEAAVTRVRMALNLAAPGESLPRGCFENLADADVKACVETVQQADDLIWGIAVNTSLPCCGRTDPAEILSRALTAAERTGKPLLVGTRRDRDVPLSRQLERLRAGDVVTYCFHGDPEGLVLGGRIRDEVWAAREKGVLFDIGHGMGSFSFSVAEAAISEGFYPDTISTDQYRRHVGSQPQHDLPRTMSKLLAAGMPRSEVLARATARPAGILGMAGEIGELTAGACADLTVLRWDDRAEPLLDTQGNERPGGCWEAILVVRAGKVVHSET